MPHRFSFIQEDEMLKAAAAFFTLAVILFVGLMVIPMSVEFGEFNWRRAVSLWGIGGSLFLALMCLAGYSDLRAARLKSESESTSAPDEN